MDLDTDVAIVGAGPGGTSCALALADRGIRSVLIDCFWERPSQFALIVHQKYREDCIDLFAGRLYDEADSAGLIAVRKVLAKSRGLEYPPA